jgi:hypothetical protein
VRLPCLISIAGLTLLAAGCGSSSPRQVSQRLPVGSPTLVPGHIVRVPVDHSRKVTPMPTLRPGVPTPVLPTVVPYRPKPHIWPASAYTASIHGVVRDARTHSPIAGATVAITHGQRSTVTDARGRYSMKFPVGGYVSVQVTRSGYLPQPGSGMLTEGQSARVDFSLQPAGAKSSAPPSFPVIIGPGH